MLSRNKCIFQINASLIRDLPAEFSSWYEMSTRKFHEITRNCESLPGSLAEHSLAVQFPKSKIRHVTKRVDKTIDVRRFPDGLALSFPPNNSAVSAEFSPGISASPLPRTVRQFAASVWTRDEANFTVNHGTGFRLLPRTRRCCVRHVDMYQRRQEIIFSPASNENVQKMVHGIRLCRISRHVLTSVLRDETNFSRNVAAARADKETSLLDLDKQMLKVS